MQRLLFFRRGFCHHRKALQSRKAHPVNRGSRSSPGVASQPWLSSII